MYITELAKANELPGSPEEFLKLRKDHGIMEMFVRFFLRNVRPKTVWNQRTKEELVGKIYTFMDEAYALLLIFNFWEDFTNIERIEEREENERERKEARARGERGPEKIREIGRYNKKPYNQMTPGWNLQGWALYQELLAHCEKERREMKVGGDEAQWDVEFLEARKRETEKRTGKTEKEEHYDAGDTNRFYGKNDWLNTNPEIKEGEGTMGGWV